MKIQELIAELSAHAETAELGGETEIEFWTEHGNELYFNSVELNDDDEEVLVIEIITNSGL